MFDHENARHDEREVGNLRDGATDNIPGNTSVIPSLNLSSTSLGNSTPSPTVAKGEGLSPENAIMPPKRVRILDTNCEKALRMRD